MKQTTLLIGLLLLCAGLAQASMRFEVLDLETRAVRIIYEVEDSLAGNRVFLFPQGGMVHDATAGEFKVESVFDVTAKQELNYEITQTATSKLPQVRITYPEPIAKGQKKVLQIAVIVNLPDSQLMLDDQGRHTFIYETSHAFEFIVPEGHYIVYSNQPVYLFEKGPNMILQQLDEKFRKLVVQTRLLKK